MKHLSGEEKWNRMITIISFLLYTTYVILAVLSLYFTSGPTPEDVALGGKFMLALAALVIAERLLSFPRLPVVAVPDHHGCHDDLGARDRWTPSSRHGLSDWLRRK